jgi:hypothetical protein
MADTVAPEFVRFISEERRANRLPASRRQFAEGELSHPIFIEHGRASELLRVAAKRAVGFFRPTKRTEVVWVQGDSELAVSLIDLDMKLSDGLIVVLIPVRCDQTGAATVEVVFAVGTPNEPAGLYASAYRRPNGPPLIVEAWGEALVAFAWQSVLGMISGIAGATGKDTRGNILVPVELTASDKGIEIVPMARHRFAGSSGLRTTSKTRGAR